MHFEFGEKINYFLKIIVNCAQLNNINIYFVGGIVRDNLLNKPLKDIDLIVDKNALEFAHILPDEIKLKSLHKDFCTAKVEYEGINIDIATTRQEHYEYSGSLPVVDKIGVDIKDDYKRRDFTVNSLYAKITLCDNHLKYELIDYANGVKDINNKTLKVLHNKSYIDDPTRILRGVNFKNRFNFDFSAQDKRLINEYLSDIDIKNASYDRIISVFKQVLHSEANFKDIVLNKYYRLINNCDLNCDLNNIGNLISIFKLKERQEFYLKILLNNNIDTLKFDNILSMKKEFSKLKDYELAYYFYKTGDNNVLKYLEIRDIQTFVSGNDLIKMGFSQGKELGDILDSLLLYKLNHPKQLKNKDDELVWIKSEHPIPLI